MYLTFGAELGFSDTGEDSVNVIPSLTEGYPLEPVQLAAIMNTARAGAYYRGRDSQKGGTVSKDTLRATINITVLDKDCGSKVFRDIYVSPDIAGALVGRYIKDGDGYKVITDIKEYIGKTIQIRSPLYCKAPGKSTCVICGGKALEGHNNGVALLMLKVSSSILIASLKKMHTSGVKTIDLDIRNITS